VDPAGLARCPYGACSRPVGKRRAGVCRLVCVRWDCVAGAMLPAVEWSRHTRSSDEHLDS
jgi:hypothetical protein